MIHLCEREIGFDAVEIGFPSVFGCRAIVFVTSGGLFGYHLNGKLNAEKQASFVNFITQHAHRGAGRMLYAASEGKGLKYDHDELGKIAAALQYGGPIYWASLPPGGSAYVHYQDVNHATCSITSRAWNDANDNVVANKADYVAGPDRAMANGAANAKMFATVGTAGLRAVYPTQI